jgi:2-polyprenyl-3-methyl-5-hydroxy-6-metoxy-1,4-benzoquinol methylase
MRCGVTMKNIYECGAYLDNNPTWHVEDSPWKAKQIIKMISRNNLKANSICEIGCGAGEILNLLSRCYTQGTQLYGYEISPQAFEICKCKSKENLEFRFGNLLEEKNSVFDIAMAIDVMEHIEDVYDFLRKFKDKAKYKIFHIPLEMSVQMVLRSTPIINVRKTVGHLHHFSKDTALAILEEAGYEIIDYFYTDVQVEFSNRGWKTAVLKYPRKLCFAINEDLAVRIMGGYSLLVLAN